MYSIIAYCSFALANPEQFDHSEIVRHPLLSAEMTEILESERAQGMSLEEVWANVRVFDRVVTYEDGSVHMDSSVVWADAEVVGDTGESQLQFAQAGFLPGELADTIGAAAFGPVQTELLTAYLADLPDGVLVQVDISMNRQTWNSRVAVPYQLDLAMMAGRVQTRGDLVRERQQVLSAWRVAGESAMADLVAQIGQSEGDLLEMSPLSGTLRASLSRSAIEQLALRADVIRIDLPAESMEDAVGHSMTVEGPVDGMEVADYIQSNPFYDRGFFGDPEETVVVTEPKGHWIRNDHPVFSDGLGVSRVSICGGTDPNLCTWVAVTDGEQHPTKVASIIGGDLTLGQDVTVTAMNQRIFRSGIARRTKLMGIGNTAPNRLVNIVTARNDAYLLNHSASGADSACTGTTTDAQQWNTMYEAGMALVNSAGNNRWADPTDCRTGSPATAIGVLAVAAVYVEDAPATFDALSGLSARGGTAAEGGGRTITGVASLTGHSRRASADPTGDQYSSATGLFGVTSAAAPTVTGAAALFRQWYRSAYGDLINTPGIMYANLLHMGDGTSELNPDAVSWIGYNNLFGAGRFRLRMYDVDGLDKPAGWESGSVCVGSGQAVYLPLRFGDPLPAGIDYIKVTTWWYDHEHDQGLGHDTYTLELQRDLGALGWLVAQTDNSIDSRQRILHSSGPLHTGGDAWRVRIYGSSVSSDSEGCGANSNRIYYALSHEANERNDDTSMQTFVRPEEL